MDLLPASITEARGMDMIFLLIVSMHVISILFMLLVIHIFRKQSIKYQHLMHTFGGEGYWGTPGKILIPVYIITTLIMTAGTLFLFIVQPHLL